MTEISILVPSFAARTVALGTTAPAGSETTPVSVADSNCAKATVLKKVKHRPANGLPIRPSQKVGISILLPRHSSIRHGQAAVSLPSSTYSFGQRRARQDSNL